MNHLKTAASIFGIWTLLFTTHKRSDAVEGPIGRVSGQWGVNRRATSDVEFSRAKGDFVIFHGLPGVYDSVRREVVTTHATNPLHSSPSFYLGGSGPDRFQDRDNSFAWTNSDNVEVDAGLQWDWIDTPASPRGWTAFISVVTVQVNPQVYNSQTQDYEPWRGRQRDYTLDYRVTAEGSIGLTVTNVVDGFGTFYWDRGARPENFTGSVWPNQQNAAYRVMNTTQLDENRVKRVIAMTRANGQTHNPDGSFLNCVFRNGKIYNPDGTEHDWTWENNSGSPTGYDSPGNATTGGGGPEAVDARRPNGAVSTLSRYKVDFPNLEGATANPNSELITEGREAGLASANEERSE